MSNEVYGCCNECGRSITQGHYRHCSLYVIRDAEVVLTMPEGLMNNAHYKSVAQEVEKLKHDIRRQQEISSELATDNEQLRKDLANWGSSCELLELDVKQLRRENKRLADGWNEALDDYEEVEQVLAVRQKELEEARRESDAQDEMIGTMKARVTRLLRLEEKNDELTAYTADVEEAILAIQDYVSENGADISHKVLLSEFHEIWALGKPPQSLADHDQKIMEDMRERCAVAMNVMLRDMISRGYAADLIRNLPIGGE